MPGTRKGPSLETRLFSPGNCSFKSVRFVAELREVTSLCPGAGESGVRWCACALFPGLGSCSQEVILSPLCRHASGGSERLGPCLGRQMPLEVLVLGGVSIRSSAQAMDLDLWPVALHLCYQTGHSDGSPFLIPDLALPFFSMLGMSLPLVTTKDGGEPRYPEHQAALDLGSFT